MPRYEERNYEIDTLIRPQHRSGGFGSSAVEFFRRVFGPSVLPEKDTKCDSGEFEQGQQKSCKDVPQPLSCTRDITVKDDSLLAEYKVKGIHTNEIPVIGTYVDKRIVPGFRYRVRILGTQQYLFHGRALALMSIGMGYGKRITFESDNRNTKNTNYFYSDTQPKGFAFSLVAICPEDQFIVNDLDCHPVAEGSIQTVDSQRELSTEVEKGAIIKRVLVNFSCNIKYSAGHGLLPLQAEEDFEQSAVAVIVKPRKAKKAHTESIEQLEISSCGSCTFEIVNPKQ